MSAYTWTNLYDRIYLINLPDRRDRLEHSLSELRGYKIPFKVWAATAHENGEMGIRITMQRLLNHAIEHRFARILVFEDDVRFVTDPNSYMSECHKQLLMQDWDLFYLGVNTHRKFEHRISPNLLQIKQGYSLHAVAYSANGMRKVLNAFNEMPDKPIDVCVEELVQPQGKCFCSYPLLATQRNNYSNIQKRDVSYDYIETRFAENTKHL